MVGGILRDMQLIKKSVFEGIESTKECLFMMAFMLDNIQVRKDILNEDKYDYLFSVELVNELVKQGRTFRDAYREVGEQIRDDKYIPDKHLDHTHEGSMGNLMNEKIEVLMKSHLDYFESRFAHINNAIRKLIDNNK